MTTGRLEAFRDGVIAIIITIMVLEMKVPHGDALKDLRPLLPVFLSYVLSFLYVGIYWNNHHHMLHTCTAVTGAMLWANLHLLFWLSLFPFTTGWMGEKPFHRSTHCALRASAVDGRNRLPPAAGGDHQRARPGINPQEGSRPRLERQAVAAAVCLSNRCSVAFCLAGASDPCDRCTDLADSGPAHRKASCNLKD